MRHKSSVDDVPGFTERLKELKAHSHLSNEQIALVCNRERKAVSHWLNGYTFPDAVSLRQLCLLFGVSADWLLGLDTAKQFDMWAIKAFE